MLAMWLNAHRKDAVWDDQFTPGRDYSCLKGVIGKATRITGFPDHCKSKVHETNIPFSDLGNPGILEQMYHQLREQLRKVGCLGPPLQDTECNASWRSAYDEEESSLLQNNQTRRADDVLALLESTAKDKVAVGWDCG